MTRLRVLIYTHCLVASACVVFTFFALDGRLKKVWPFKVELRKVVHSPVGTCLGYLWGVSSLAFTACILARVSDRRKEKISELVRWGIVIAGVLLGTVQLGNLIMFVRFY